jgi:AcrR family transcriptional regulator
MTDAPTTPRTGLRELTRASVRGKVADHALRMFDENGFDATTVGDIAESLGISARSFFRYFPAKEDVVIGDPTPLGIAVRDAALSRPAEEPVWTVLRRCLEPLELATLGEPEVGLRIMRVMMSTASLRARNLEKHVAWGAMLEPVIVQRIDGPEATRLFRVQTLIHCALACLDVALAEWTRRAGASPVTELLDDAFSTMKPEATKF